MRTFLISATIFVLVLILIITFQNLASTCAGFWVLFISIDQQSSASTLVLFLTGLGFFLGVLATSLVMSLLNSSKDTEEPGGSNW